MFLFTIKKTTKVCILFIPSLAVTSNTNGDVNFEDVKTIKKLTGMEMYFPEN